MPREAAPLAFRKTPSAVHRSHDPARAIEELLASLARVRLVRFRYLSGQNVQRIGRGHVKVDHANPARIRWHESGIWTTMEGRSFDFRNTTEWRVDRHVPSLCLFHLRRGAGAPVHLATLAVRPGEEVLTRDVHRCGEDEYRLNLQRHPGKIQLTWTISGPRKNQQIHITYREPGYPSEVATLAP